MNIMNIMFNCYLLLEFCTMMICEMSELLCSTITNGTVFKVGEILISTMSV